MAIPILSGTQLYINSLLLPKVADGTAITSISDNSGQGNNATQTSGTASITYRTNAATDGLPTIRFAGSQNSGRAASGTFANWGTPVGWTLIIAMRRFVPPPSFAYSGFFGMSEAGGSDFSSAGGAVVFPADGPSGNIGAIVMQATRQLMMQPMPLGNNLAIFGLGVSTTEVASFGPRGQLFRGPLSSSFAAPTGYAIGDRYFAAPGSDRVSVDIAGLVLLNRLWTEAESNDYMPRLSRDFKYIPAIGPYGSKW